MFHILTRVTFTLLILLGLITTALAEGEPQETDLQKKTQSVDVPSPANIIQDNRASLMFRPPLNRDDNSAAHLGLHLGTPQNFRLSIFTRSDDLAESGSRGKYKTGSMGAWGVTDLFLEDGTSWELGFRGSFDVDDRNDSQWSYGIFGALKGHGENATGQLWVYFSRSDPHRWANYWGWDAEFRPSDDIRFGMAMIAEFSGDGIGFGAVFDLWVGIFWNGKNNTFLGSPHSMGLRIGMLMPTMENMPHWWGRGEPMTGSGNPEDTVIYLSIELIMWGRKD